MRVEDERGLKNFDPVAQLITRSFVSLVYFQLAMASNALPVDLGGPSVTSRRLFDPMSHREEPGGANLTGSLLDPVQNDFFFLAFLPFRG